MDVTSNDDIMRILGRVEEGVKRIREDFQEEKQNAHDSRAVIHKRLDDQTEKIAHLETSVAISGKVDAQLRDELAELRKAVKSTQESVSPAIEEWKRMKTLGVGISGLIAFAGLTIGSLVAWAGDTAVGAIRAWLKIH
jgi:ferritin-like protein